MRICLYWLSHFIPIAYGGESLAADIAADLVPGSSSGVASLHIKQMDAFFSFLFSMIACHFLC